MITFAVSREASPERDGETDPLPGANESVPVVTPEVTDGVQSQVLSAAAHPAVPGGRDPPAGLHTAGRGLATPLAGGETQPDTRA